MTHKPAPAPGQTCPLRRKDVSKVCPSCAWYTRINGTHPATGQPVSEWMCAVEALVLTGIESTRTANVNAATTQELRNDLQRERQAQTRILAMKLTGQPQQKYLNGNVPLSLTDDRQGED
jgi:hypothetical protein